MERKADLVLNGYSWKHGMNNINSFKSFIQLYQTKVRKIKPRNFTDSIHTENKEHKCTYSFSDALEVVEKSRSSDW